MNHVPDVLIMLKRRALLGDDASTYATQSIVNGLPANSTPDSFIKLLPSNCNALPLIAFAAEIVGLPYACHWLSAIKSFVADSSNLSHDRKYLLPIFIQFTRL
jgi:hypothetical protein